MPILETKRFRFEPDMKLIQAQCDAVARKNPRLKRRAEVALRRFKAARDYVDQGDIERAFMALREVLKDTLDVRAVELQASCLFYFGSLALLAGSDSMGVDLLQKAAGASRNTQLILAAHNRLMVKHLSSGQMDAVKDSARVTEGIVTAAERSDASVYYGAAARYNLAEMHFRQCEFSEAVPQALEALRGFEELSMDGETAKCLGILGCSRISCGDVEQGFADTERSLGLLKGFGDDQEMAVVFEGRAMGFLAQRRKDEATRDLREALNLFKRLDDTEAINTTLASLSLLENG